MTDLALHWDTANQSGDLALASGALVSDDGMRTAIVLSLFTDARAPDDAALPEAGSDRRGWWGNDFVKLSQDPKRSELGSLLWLLRRSKMTQSNIALAKSYVTAALQWLVSDRVASSLSIIVEAQGPDRLAIAVELTRPNGPARQRYDFTWENSL
jgi:phage gp46-like protein